jgi:GNAT superfamily N-acetyltransferase
VTAADACVIADFNARMAMETENLKLDPPTVLAGVRAALADESKAIYFLAEISNQAVAQLMLTHEWSDWRNADIWWIQSVYVHSDFRRKGIFKSLFEHVEKTARQSGVTGLRLYVERINDGARKTYESLGMELSHYDMMEKMWAMFNLRY